ncbi:D-glycero-beta-D-manno-heptose 1-phosphate adenylyltransferase [Cryptosporangium arvum]|uniref:D-glycero-beta-D-manno-heptose 1-phosphate adenylyltransferase n=1 Tax=Cryptosporangium arvum DSM 44712 TaxID=927661 RepID=A0A010YNG9_9ACTN|nr:D-glycero-beta-D-manno-heptose 1-phosphate adenylyltransferase [Cryptosporangium arvum]EXG81715.1 D-heptose-1-phosphate adenylyltransferase [Cryptosporangium arvum DSM 44712]
MSAPLVVVGDALLDRDLDGDATRLAPDAPVPVVDLTDERARPGGAALAACLAAERTAREVVLVTAIGSGPDADTLRGLLAGRVRLVELPLRGDLPVKTRVRAGGRPLLRVDRGDGVPLPPSGADLDAVLRGAAAILVADYGRGVADVLRPNLRTVTRPGSERVVPVVWDPHPRGGDPVPGARLVTPNLAEAAGTDAAGLAARWGASDVAVTMGSRGAVLSRGSASPMLVPAPFVASGDPCGAGDCFSATVAVALADGALPEEAVSRAVAAASAFVESGGAAAWPGPSTTAVRRTEGLDGALALAERVRARGGTVVATGGCFDLLHAGHVGLLEAARRTGDCLIVCLNSDASVTRLKGPGRPLNTAADRTRVLTGLVSVDAVVVFDEDTPERVLGRLRPDRWVKGGDYTVDALPEAAVVRSWGGEAVVLPYLDGHSTTDLVHRASVGAVR